MSRTKVLFIVNEIAHYREFKKILSFVEIRSQIDYLILFDRDGYDLTELFSREIKDCEENGLSYALLPQSKNHNRSTSSGFVSRIKNQIAFYQNKIHALKDFFILHNIHSIVLGEENILMDTFVYKKAFEKKLVLVYPYTIPNAKEMAGGAELVIPSNKPSSLLVYLFGGRFVKKWGPNIFLLIRPYKILAMLAVGYLPSNPWILNSDTADFICIESQKMADLYHKLGIKTSRLKVIGSLNDDILADISADKDSKKNAFLKKYNLPDKPIILVGFPPSQFPLKSAEFSNYDDLIRSWSNSLQPFLSDYSIVITKHPRTSHSFESMSRMGLTVVSESTIDLIPFAHLYIASVSATIRWALAAGVVVINYDTYRYKYLDYDHAAGVTTVYSETEFKEELRKTLTDSSYYASAAQKVLKESHTWGLLDGNVSKRFVNLLVSQN